MTNKYAILIDGGFIKKVLGSQENPLDSKQLHDFTQKLVKSEELKDLQLYRVYYYDAMPLAKSVPFFKPFSGQYDFLKTSVYTNSKELIDNVKKLDFFAVRLGELVYQGWKVNWRRVNNMKNMKNKNDKLNLTKECFTPDVKQKGVDMRIGLDIASLSLKKHVDVIVLVTGDADFIPALKFARREGKQTYLVTLGHKINQSLYAHCDVCIEKQGEQWLKNSEKS